MKISKAKERALMKEFGLDETVLSEEDLNKRRLSLKALIKLGKTRGYLTHGEISDHLPDKLVDAETMEVVVSMLNDMGVAVYEHTPDAETLLLNQNGPTAATEEEAEEEAEAALSTVDSEFGRTTDPVRMYMREMGTVELLTREGEIEIAKRIEGGLMAMMEAISASPASIVEILKLGEDIRSDKVVITTIVDGFTNPNEADDYVAEEDFDEFDAEDDDDGNGAFGMSLGWIPYSGSCAYGVRSTITPFASHSSACSGRAITISGLSVVGRDAVVFSYRLVKLTWLSAMTLMPHSFFSLNSVTSVPNRLDSTPYHGCQTLISTPFKDSSLTPRLVAGPLVDTGFGVFVAACAANSDDDGSLVDVASDEPQADKMMEAMKSRERFFSWCNFMVPMS